MFYNINHTVFIATDKKRSILYHLESDNLFEIEKYWVDFLKYISENSVDEQKMQGILNKFNTDISLLKELLQLKVIYLDKDFKSHNLFDNNIVKKHTLETFKKRPKKITLYITKACPLNCIHCAVSAWKKGPMELSDDEWMNVMKQIVKEKFDLFQISWGEPFLRKELIIKMINKYWKKIKNIVINTNALYIDDEILDLLERNSVIVYVSIYWHNRELYKGITWLDLFDKANIWIDKLTSRNIDVRASVPMINDFINNIDKINEYIKSKGISRIAYMWLIPAWRAKDNFQKLIKDSWSDYLPKMLEYCWKSEVMFENFSNNIMDIPCHSYSVRLSIDNQWSAYPCEFLPIYLWNVRDQRLKDIIQGDSANYCYKELDANEIVFCKWCAYKYACKAICPSMTYMATGNHLNPPPTCNIAVKSFYSKLNNWNLFWK